MPISVDVIDPGFSDHRLLRWSCSLQKSAPVYETSTYRPWQRLDVDRFRDELRRSALCCDVTSTDVNTLAEQYDAELTTILDRILPLRTSTRRRRPSDPWFDNDCRNAKRRYRKLERHASRSASDACNAWKQQRRVYRHLISQKREAFWQNLIAQQSRTPRRMWQSIDNCWVAVSYLPTTPSVQSICIVFFEKKVADTYAHLRMALPTRPTLILTVHFRALHQSLLMKLQLRC